MRQRPGTGTEDPLSKTHPFSHSLSLLSFPFLPPPFLFPLSLIPPSFLSSPPHWLSFSSLFILFLSLPPSPLPPAGVPLDSDIPTSVFHPPTRETALNPTSTFGPKPFLFVPEQVRRPRHSFVPRKVSPVCVSRESGGRVKSLSLFFLADFARSCNKSSLVLSTLSLSLRTSNLAAACTRALSTYTSQCIVYAHTAKKSTHYLRDTSGSFSHTRTLAHVYNTTLRETFEGENFANWLPVKIGPKPKFFTDETKGGPQHFKF